MSTTDKLFLGLFFGFAFPFSLFLSGLAVWFFFFQNFSVYPFVLTGFLAGLVIDRIFLKWFIENGFMLSNTILAVFYLFYATCIYGFFMGFPIFNLGMGIVAGYYYSRRIYYMRIPSDESRLIMRKVSLFSAAVMLPVCIISAIIANMGEGVGSDLQGMFRLPFEVTRLMIWTVILIGGPALIILQYHITRLVMSKTAKR
jgi:hypothetical protein